MTKYGLIDDESWLLTKDQEFLVLNARKEAPQSEPTSFANGNASKSGSSPPPSPWTEQPTAADGKLTMDLKAATAKAPQTCRSISPSPPITISRWTEQQSRYVLGVNVSRKPIVDQPPSHDVEGIHAAPHVGPAGERLLGRVLRGLPRGLVLKYRECFFARITNPTQDTDDADAREQDNENENDE